MNGETKLVGDSQEAQKASLHACPSSVADHKKPEVMPVGDKAATGFKPA